MSDTFMTPSFDPRPAARRLAAAWKSGGRVPGLPEAERPSDIEQAYAIQAALRDEIGEGIAGWKIGGASVSGRHANPDAPTFGFLWPSRMRASGATLEAPAPGTLTIEIEIAVRFARTAYPAQEPLQPAEMIDAAYVAAEIVCSRYLDGKAAGPLSFLADDAGFHAFVQGDSLRGATQSSLLHAPAALYRDGQAVGEPLYGDDCTDPLVALELFWARMAARGGEVAAGSIITTGTLIKPFESAPAGDYEGRLGDRRVAFRI